MYFWLRALGRLLNTTYIISTAACTNRLNVPVEVAEHDDPLARRRGVGRETNPEPRENARDVTKARSSFGGIWAPGGVHPVFIAGHTPSAEVEDHFGCDKGDGSKVSSTTVQSVHDGQHRHQEAFIVG